jgi:hypothetical protein
MSYEALCVYCCIFCVSLHLRFAFERAVNQALKMPWCVVRTNLLLYGRSTSKFTVGERLQMSLRVSLSLLLSGPNDAREGPHAIVRDLIFIRGLLNISPQLLHLPVSICTCATNLPGFIK